MTNYNKLSQDIYTTKRSIVNFSSQLSKGMTKPNKNFILEVFWVGKGEVSHTF